MINNLYCSDSRRSKFLGITISTLLLLSSGCNSTTSPDNPETEAEAQTVVVNFADQVVVPTYELLVTEAEQLTQAIDTFVNNPNQENLEAAQTAWIEARYPWEQSEAFAFGPADSLGYDADLDDWPVNETDVQAVLDSEDELTLEYVETLQSTQKGFHTIEYLLFGTNNQKQVSDFSERELQLLDVLSVAFAQSANELAQSWVEGVQGNRAYREVLATAGSEDNPAYPTTDAAVAEILQGMLATLDEVANEKIGEPLETGENIGFESRFSHTSLNDFENNLKSVKYAYLGEIGAGEAESTSLSDLVAGENPELDAQVRNEIEAALEAVRAIPAPVEVKQSDDQVQAKMKTAQQEILTLFSTIEQEVLPLLNSSS